MARPAADDRKRSILDAVVQVIIEVGYTAMTVGDVAARAGVSTALVHYHFSSKPELIAAALGMASDEDKALRQAIIDGDGSFLAKIDRVLIGSLPEDADDRSWLLWVETWGETRRSDAVRTVMADLADHEAATVVALIEAGRGAGEFDCPDPALAAQRLLALRDGLAIQHTLFDSPSPAHDHAALLRNSIARNLGLDPATHAAATTGSTAGPEATRSRHRRVPNAGPVSG